MKITYKDVVNINQLYDAGIVINQGSLDFALTSIKKDHDWLEQLAYLLRALLTDHVFRDGNKRTATTLLLLHLERQGFMMHEQDIVTFVIALAKDVVTDIKEIKRRLALFVY